MTVNRLAIFDCDGTLVDSGGSIHASLCDAFAEHGLARPCPRSSRRVVGLSLQEAMAVLLPDARADDHAALAETYKRAFHRRRTEGRIEEMLYPGISELLQRLEEDGWLLAVATGKSDRGLRYCLEANGIAARFCSLQTADRHPSKPHPSMALQAMADAGASPETSMVIGDTRFDMAMAKAAGMAGVGVSWGYHEPEELIAESAILVADTPEDIGEFAARWPERADG